jgi:hypothetical protein
MEITQEQLVGWAREIDAQLAIPQHPEDYTTPLDFGTCGVVVMSDNSPMLIATGDDPWELLTSDEVRVFAQGFGSFFLVTVESKVMKNADKVAKKVKEANVNLEDLLATLDEERKNYYKEHYVKN